MHLEKLPPELWEEIGRLACTDNGYTGRSLSLVSRYVHNATKSTKMWSLSVTSRREIGSLAALMQGSLSRSWRIANLFIGSPRLWDNSERDDSDDSDYQLSDGGDDDDDGDDVHSDSDSSSHGIPDSEEHSDIEEDLAFFKTEEHREQTSNIISASQFPELLLIEEQKIDEQLKHDILYILRAASPTLRVLHIHLALSPLAIDFPLPVLGEMLMCRARDLAHLSALPSPPSALSPSSWFPSLRHLSIVGCDSVLPLPCLTNLNIIAPSLIHLRMSGLIWWTCEMALSTLPPTVERVTMSDFPVPISARSIIQKELEALDKLAQQRAKIDIVYTFADWHGLEMSEVERHWLHLVGGEGCDGCGCSLMFA